MKRFFNIALALAAVAFVATSCGSCYSNMAKNSSNLMFSATPEILELNNGMVTADITIDFPAKFFNENTIAKIVPMIVFADGEVEGTPFYFQGSKVEDNYRVVSVNGGKFTQRIEFAYEDYMQISQLLALVEFKCAGDAEFSVYNAAKNGVASSSEAEDRAACAIYIAQGVNTLQRDIRYADFMMPHATGYQRVTNHVTTADIDYVVNSSVVRNAQLRSSEIADFKALVNEQKNNERIEQRVFANGYASPEGPTRVNDRLSAARSQSAKTAMTRILRGSGLNIDQAAYGEDWDGFKELVMASDMEDKDLILQVLSLYTSSAQRETEIKNLSNVYKELKTDILPQLRRTQMVNSSDITGLSDEEMIEVVKAGNLSELRTEELLHLAENVFAMPQTKLALLQYAAKNNNDARAYNNLGILYAQLGDEEASLASFVMASTIGEGSIEINNNIILSNLDNNQVDEAVKYASAATPATKTAIEMATGNYSAKGVRGYNAAIAAFMNGNYTAANSAIAEDTSAEADYLRAITAVRTGDMKIAESQLNSAVAKNEAMKAKAQKDINLLPLFEGGFEF